MVDTTATLGDPGRCIHIGDREADIYELFCAANDVATHFLVRTSANRMAEDGTTKTEMEMGEAEVAGLHRLEVQDRNGDVSEAILEIKYRRMLVLAPVAEAKDYGPLELTVIHAIERGTPKGRDKIVWKLLTDLPVRSLQEAIEKLGWYALRCICPTGCLVAG